MKLETLAAYATIFAAGGLIVGGIWRLWTWRQEHGTHVTVQISWGGLAFGPDLVEAVLVTVFNRSRHPVRVTGCGVEINDGSKRAGHVMQIKPGAGIPGVVTPHDSAMTWLERADLEHEGFNMYRKARAFALLADRTGGPVWSKRRTLMRRS
jgi:hypothetical protein